MPRSLRRLRVVAAVAAIAACLVPSQVRADSFVWTGGNTAVSPWGGLFSTATNWSGGVAPPGAAPPDTMTFGGSGAFGYAAINDLWLSPPNLSSLTFNSSATAASFLRGELLEFSGTAQIAQTTAGQFVVENELYIGSDLALKGAGAGIVALAGTIGGTGGIVKSEASTYVLRGMNSYGGATSVNAGTLIAAGNVLGGVDGALGNSSSIVTLAGGSLLLAGQAQMDRGLDVTGSAVFGTNTVGYAHFSGSAQFNGVTAPTLTLNSVTGASFVVSGSIGGTGNVILGSSTVNAGTVRLTASNNYTGTTTLTNGRLGIGADSMFDGPAGSPTLITAGPLGTGTFSFGTGTTVLAMGAARTIVNPLADLTSTSALTFTFGGAQNLEFTRSWSLMNGSGTVSRTLAVLTNPGVVTFSGNLTSTGAAITSLTKTGLGTLSLAGTNTFNGGLTISAGTVLINGEGALGTVPVSGANVTLNGGTLAAAADLALPTGRNIALGTSGGTLNVSAGATWSIGGNLTGANTLNVFGSGILELNGTVAATLVNVAGGTTLTTTQTAGQTLVGGASGTLALAGATLTVPTGATTSAVPRLQYTAGANLNLAAGARFTTSEAAATALGRVNFGTLVITTAGTLGADEQFVVTNAAAQPGSTSGMLGVPSIVWRNAAGDADFVTYAGSSGFAPKTTTPLTTTFLSASAPTLSWEPGAGSNLLADATIEVLAVRSAGNIDGAGPDALLQIASGGLILNGGVDAPQINSGLFFGSGSTAREALVYVKGGYGTGTATLGGSVTALNFTKFGPGMLRYTGPSFMLAPTAAGLRNVTIQEGVLQFGTSAAVPFANFTVNDTGALDVNGATLTIPGLSGSGIVGNSSGTVAGRLVVASNNQTTTFGGTLQDAIAGGAYTMGLTKAGSGTLVLAGRSNYSDGTTIESGSITSAAGIFSSTGVLQVNDVLGLGSGPVTLAGGTLDLRYDGAAIGDVVRGLNVTTFGPGAGYDVTVAAVNNFGGANTTSTINASPTVGTGLYLTMNNLTLDAPVLNVTNTGTFGVRFAGTTTLSGDAILNVGSGGTLVLDGKIDAAGKTLTKLGAGTLLLGNVSADVPSDFAGVVAVAGSIEARLIGQGSNPLGAADPVILSGGTLTVRHDGDGTNSPQLIDAGFGIVVNGTDPADILRTWTGVTTLTIGPTVSGPLNKTIAFAGLTLGAVQGTSSFRVTTVTSTTYSAQFGTTTFLRDASLNYANTVSHQGAIDGYGTLYRLGVGNLYLGADNTYAGGTILAAGNALFGSYVGTLYTPNTVAGTTARLGTGRVTVLPGAALQLNEIANLHAGQTIDVRGNSTALGVLRIAGNFSPGDARLRAVVGGLTFDTVTSGAKLQATGLLAINAANYSQALDLARIGDGTWILGSTQSGWGVNGVYTAATLGGGAGNVYRLGGGSGNVAGAVATASLTIAQADVLTGSAALQIGTPFKYGVQAALGNVVLAASQDYTGVTTVYRNSLLEFRGATTTASLDIMGTVVVGGGAGSLSGVVGTMALRPSGVLRFDNTLGVSTNRWRLSGGDPEGITLNSSTLGLVGNSGANSSQAIGTVTLGGGSVIALQRLATNRLTTLNVAGFNRAVGQTLGIASTAARLGVDEQLVVGTAPTLVNSMAEPWIINTTDNAFVTYGGGSFTGYNNMTFSTQAGGTLSSTLGTGVQIYDVTGALVLNAGVNIDAWAMRLTGTSINISKAGAAPFNGTQTVNLGSGGLITTGTSTHRVTANLSFAQGMASGTREAILYTAGTGTLAIGDFTSGTGGQITADHITKFGTGILQLDAVQAGFTGNIYLNGGSLLLRNNLAAGSGGGKQAGTGGSIYLNANGVLVSLRGETATTFLNTLVMSQDVTAASVEFRNASAATSQAIGISGLTFLGGTQQQVLSLTGASSHTLTIPGTVTLNGLSTLNLTTGSTMTIFGRVTGGGTLARMGLGTIVLSNLSTSTPNDFAGGIELFGGTLTAHAAGTNPIAYSTSFNVNSPFNNSPMTVTSSTLGSGPITLYGGTLNILADGSAVTSLTEILPLGNNVVVAGNAAISAGQRTTAGGTFNRIALGSLTIGSQTLAVAGTNNYAVSFTSLNIRGTAQINTTVAAQPILIDGITSDNGGSALAAALGLPAGTAFALQKTGVGDMYFNGTIELGNGILVNGGNIRTGLPWNHNPTVTTSSAVTYPNTSVRYGTGLIVANAGGTVRIDTVNTLGPGQQIKISGNAAGAAGIRLAGSTNTANLSMAYLQNIFTADSGSGVIYFDGTQAYTGSSLNMALIGDGTWYIAAGNGSVSYGTATVKLLPGAPATPGGLPAFRFGSVLNQLSAGVNDLMSGAARLIVGGYAVGTLGSTASIYNEFNTYTGGTDMMRGQSVGQTRGSTDGVGSTPIGNSVWGSGAIEVYGGWTMYQRASHASADGLDTLTPIHFHPGSSLSLTPNTSVNTNSNRLGDNTPIAFDGTVFSIQSSPSTPVSSETIGAASFARGTHFRLLADGGANGATSIIINGDLTRTADAGMFNFGTLTIQADMVATTGPAYFPHALGSASQKLKLPGVGSLPAPLYGTVNAGAGAPVGMAPAYIVNASDLTFVTYDDANGFQNLIPTTAPAAGQTAYQYVVNVSNPSFPTGLTGGTATVAVETATTLGDNPSLFALRAVGNINNAPGQINTIYFTSDAALGLHGGLIAGGAVTIGANLNFGNGAGEALIFNAAAGATGTPTATGGALNINGDIIAGSITKFGVGTLLINKDQSHAGGWVINQGSLQLTTLGAAGQAVASNRITLNGPVSLTLSVNTGNALNAAYTSGTIYAVDDATINFRPVADDRTATIAAITVRNTAPGDSYQAARLTYSIDRLRAILNAGVLTLDAVQTDGNSNAMIVVNASGSVGSSGSGLYVAGLAGENEYTTLRKWGNGTFYVDGDNSASWTGIASIEQSALQVLHQNALGAAGTSQVKVLKNGVLDIGIAGFARTEGIAYSDGSGERWSVDNARIGPGAPSVLNVGKATLQIGADQTNSVAGTLTVQLNGGSIEGFLRNDDVLPAVYRTVGAGIGFELLGDSYLGQNILHGVNGVDNGKIPTFNSPFANTLTGAQLELKGGISGVGSLTKINYDTVVLSGQSTFTGGLNITAGVVQIAGGDDRLPVAGRLLTASGGVFDLNGLNQRVGSLVSAHGTIAGVPVDGGWIYNSAVTASMLTVGTSASATYAYGGLIYGNIGLTKIGGPNNVLQLLAANTYNGGTFLDGGVLSVASETVLGAAGTGLSFAGGTLRFTADGNLTRPVALSAAGGALDVEAGKTLNLLAALTGAGGLRFTGGGMVQYASVGGFAGTTTVVAGALAFTAGSGAALGSGNLELFGGRVVVNGAAGPASQTLPVLAAAGSGALVIDAPVAPATIALAGLDRSGRGTLFITPQQGSFGFNELVTVDAPPPLSGGILAPWAVVQTSAADSSADFLTLDGTTLKRATYTQTGSLDAGLIGDVFYANTSGTLTADRAVLALRTDQLINGLFTLAVGTGSGLAGLILNGGTLDTAELAFGGAEALVYAGGTPLSTINAVVTGMAGFTKFGPQSLLLAGRNTYTGDTYVYGGTLVVGRNANLGGAGNLTVGGAALETAGRFSMSRALHIAPGDAVVRVTGNGRLTVVGPVTGAALTKEGTGTLVLGGTNTYVGNTTVAAGMLSVAADDRLGHPDALLLLAGGTLQTTASFTTGRAVTLGAAGGTFDVAPTATLTYTGLLTGPGNFTKTGAGTMEVAADTQFAGTTTVAGGTLRLLGWNQYVGATTVDFGTLEGRAVGPSKSPFGTTASATLNNGTLHLVGLATQTLTGVGGALTVGGGATLVVDTTAGGRTALTFGSLARSGTGTLVIVPTSGNLNNIDLSLTGGEFVGFMTAPTLTNGIIAPWAVRQAGAGDSTGDFLTLTGTYVQRAAYSAELDINAAAVTPTTVFNLLTNSALSGPKTVYALRMAYGTTLSGSATLTVGSGATTVAGIILNGSDITTTGLAFGSREGLLYAGGSMAGSISSTISGTAGLTKFGDQTLVITGTNNVTGVVSLNGGRLSVSVDTALGSTTDATLRFNGGTLRATDSFDMAAARSVALNAGFGTFEVAPDKTLLIPAALSGVGGFLKADTGTLTLAHSANDYVGETHVAGGTLFLPASASLTATSRVVVASGAVLQLAAGASISSAADVVVAGTAAVDGTVAGYANVTAGGTLTGTGQVGGLEVGPGATVAPGTGVGTLGVASNFGNVWSGGGTLEFQFRNADLDLFTPGTQGDAGTDWDFINLMDGSLDITATSADRITLQVDSWLIDNSGHGSAENFDPLASYSWKFLEANGGITFSGGTDVFTVESATAGSGVFGTDNPYTLPANYGFWVSATPTALFLVYDQYATVPEPSSLLLTALAGLGYAYRRRRRQRHASAEAEVASATS